MSNYQENTFLEIENEFFFCIETEFNFNFNVVHDIEPYATFSTIHLLPYQSLATMND